MGSLPLKVPIGPKQAGNHCTATRPGRLRNIAPVEGASPGADGSSDGGLAGGRSGACRKNGTLGRILCRGGRLDQLLGRGRPESAWTLLSTGFRPSSRRPASTPCGKGRRRGGRPEPMEIVSRLVVAAQRQTALLVSCGSVAHAALAVMPRRKRAAGADEVELVIGAVHGGGAGARTKLAVSRIRHDRWLRPSDLGRGAELSVTVARRPAAVRLGSLSFPSSARLKVEFVTAGQP